MLNLGMDDVLDRKRALCLLQIMETGSVRGAADVLEVDPSMVSRTVARLEQDTGLVLLERRGRGVVVTDAGRMLALFARRQQDLHDTFVAEVNSLKNAQSGHLDLVLGEGTLDMVMAPVLQDFVKAHGDVRYHVKVAGTEEAVQCILEDRAHIGIVFQPPADARLRSHHARLAPVRVHVRKGHPLASHSGPLSLADLAPYPGAALEESFGVRKHIQAAELEENVRLQPMLTTNSFKVLWDFAVMGLGYIMTPRSIPLQGVALETLVSLPLASPVLNHSQLHVVTRSGRPLSPVASQLLRHMVGAFSAS